MMLIYRAQLRPSVPPPLGPDTVGVLPAIHGELGQTTVVAAWPAGVSQLAQAIDASQRCDNQVIRSDWIARARG